MSMRKTLEHRQNDKVQERADQVVDVHNLSLYIRWSGCWWAVSAGIELILTSVDPGDLT